MPSAAKGQAGRPSGSRQDQQAPTAVPATTAVPAVAAVLCSGAGRPRTTAVSAATAVTAVTAVLGSGARRPPG
eukprot:5844060-Lingulodinium_polyedra.AAC.1